MIILIGLMLYLLTGFALIIMVQLSTGRRNEDVRRTTLAAFIWPLTFLLLLSYPSDL